MCTAAAADAEGADGALCHPEEFAIVQEFMRLLGPPQARGGGDSFYDPLA